MASVIQGSAEWRNISISDEARVHVGHNYVTNINIITSPVKDKQVAPTIPRTTGLNEYMGKTKKVFEYGQVRTLSFGGGDSGYCPPQRPKNPKAFDYGKARASSFGGGDSGYCPLEGPKNPPKPRTKRHHKFHIKWLK